MSLRGSLFDNDPSSPLTTGTGWIVQLLTGTLATTLCVIAIALLGYLMLIGRFRVIGGFRVVLGCFIVLGSAQIAAAINDISRSNARSSSIQETTILERPVMDLPPSEYSPYANPSQRED